MHFVLALDGRVRVRTSQRGRWATAAGVLTSPDTPHTIDARGVEVLVVFFDPESDVGAALWPAIQMPLRLISEGERAELLRGVEDFRSLPRADAARWARHAATTLGLSPRVTRRVLHPGVRRLLARLRTSGVDDDTSLEGLAEAVGSVARPAHARIHRVGRDCAPPLPLVAAGAARGLRDRCRGLPHRGRSSGWLRGRRPHGPYVQAQTGARPVNAALDACQPVRSSQAWLRLNPGISVWGWSQLHSR